MDPPLSPSHIRRPSLITLSRNVGTVLLGNLDFETWYFSPYPETVIHGPDHHPSRTHVNGDARNGHLEKVDAPQIPKLHVCPYCFRYTTRLDDYVQHVQHHVQEAEADPEGWWPVPESAVKVYEWDGYSVWDIDGEQEKLYCQNLSLFGKLFLEQKSVFFDTSSFHYFVLTYTPPQHANLAPSSFKARGRKRTSSGLPADLGLKTQVLGFFSKENLSWDANNLACILVFPPFQHRNLGQLLMAISYKLSGWEWEDSIIGGPEKPLSAMGRKSYLRFWSERIARFFMGQTADADGRRVFDQGRKKRVTFAKEEMSIKQIGDRTGMLAEDVIAALMEMGICEVNSPKRKKKSDDSHQQQGEEEIMPATMTVKRTHVLEWAQGKGVDLVNPVKEEGFLGEWALSDVEHNEDEDEHVSSESS